MLKLLQLIFAPMATWTKIAEAKRGVLWVVVMYLLPLMLLGALAEGYGLMKLGMLSGEFDRTKPVLVPQGVVIRYEEARLAIHLVLLVLGTQLLQWMAQSFHLRVKFPAAFTVVAYSVGPAFLAQALDGVPYVNTWLCWACGALLAVHLIYHGIALVLQPDQTKGFGLFLLAALMLLILMGLGNFVAQAVLKGKLMG